MLELNFDSPPPPTSTHTLTPSPTPPHPKKERKKEIKKIVSVLQDSHFCFIKKLATCIEEGIQIQA